MASNQFSMEALVTHNQYRERHGAPPLRLNSDLAQTAQEWADQLVSHTRLENSPMSCQGDVGENISSRTSSSKNVDISGRDVTDHWYNDIKNYDFTNGTGTAGNFTQVVWLGTDEVGFGKSQADGRCLVVAHYRPPGNVRGLFKQNVLPSGSISGAAPEIVEDVPQGKLTRSKVVTETIKEPDGEHYTIRREISEYTDEHGHVTQRVREMRLGNDEGLGSGHKREECFSDESSDSETDVKGHSHGAKKKGDKMDRPRKAFAKEIVKAHNFYRKRHGVPLLKHSKELSGLAQKWAEHVAQESRLSNSAYVYNGDRVGENIASRWSNGPCDYGGQEVIDQWYTECKKYNFDEEPTSVKGIGNFTQMIWRNAREIGVGKAFVHSEFDDSMKVVVVCQYHPAGNVLRCFKHNVQRPK